VVESKAFIVTRNSTLLQGMEWHEARQMCWALLLSKTNRVCTVYCMLSFKKVSHSFTFYCRWGCTLLPSPASPKNQL